MSVSARDIALWFLNHNLSLRDIENEDTDDISNLKLQKLLYYAQGSYLGLYDKPLFDDAIFAWKHGPVVEGVYHEFKQNGSRGIVEFDNAPILDDETENVLKQVYDVFGKYSAWGLREMTHNETPWKSTKLNHVIDIELIKEYFKENYVA